MFLVLLQAKCSMWIMKLRNKSFELVSGDHYRGAKHRASYGGEQPHQRKFLHQLRGRESHRYQQIILDEVPRSHQMSLCTNEDQIIVKLI